MRSRCLILTAAACVAFTGCSKKSGDWHDANAELIKKHNITARVRSIPETDVPLSAEQGKARPKSALPKATIAPGVTASLNWSKGALLEMLEMDKGSAYPSQQLNEEVIAVVREGSATCEFGGKTVELAADSILYLAPGTTRTLKAGPDGLKALEVFSPVRASGVNVRSDEFSLEMDPGKGNSNCCRPAVTGSCGLNDSLAPLPWATKTNSRGKLLALG